MSKYRHETTRYSLGETGDYSETTKITNDVETHYIHECELSDEDLNKLCELLDEIPSLWNVKNDALEFENIQLKSKLEQAEKEKKDIITEIDKRIESCGDIHVQEHNCLVSLKRFIISNK